jgi:hypothetical protein
MARAVARRGDRDGPPDHEVARATQLIAAAARAIQYNSETRLAFVDEIVFQDSHLELERTIIVLVVDKQHTDEFLADIDFRRVIFLRSRHDTNFRIAEQTLEIRIELPDFLNVHEHLQ